MKHRNLLSALPAALLWVAALACPAQPAAAPDLDECQRLARENYPLLRRYGLVQQTVGLTLENLEKTFLPRIALTGQATLQSATPELPAMLKNLLAQNGYHAHGLALDQYSVAVDVQQLIYDGGRTRAAREVARLDEAAEGGKIESELYALRSRVNDLYFGILLLDGQLALNEEVQTLLADNRRKVEALVGGGLALPSDVDAIEAERLQARQQQASLEATQAGYRDVLALFIGRAVEGPLAKPVPQMPAELAPQRPELAALDARAAQTTARMRQLDADLRPTLSAFARGFYGYPGYNMFDDMFSRKWSLNGMVGLRVSWNLDRFYTRKTERRRLATALDEIENAREVFLFNNRLQARRDRAAIVQYTRVMAEDDEIIRLRTSVRRAAEARLEGGVVDVNDLLREITAEHRARIDRTLHEVQLLKSICELKNTLNR